MAFRQAKIALYFERRGVGLLELAAFERDLSTNLRRLRGHLAENGFWFDGVPIGGVYATPKKLQYEEPSNSTVIRVGDIESAPEDVALDVQLRLAPSPEFATLEVLYLWKFGHHLDALLTPDVLGYRLDLRDGELRREARRLFEYWPRRYEEFRTKPLDSALKALSKGPVVIVSADLESFYDTINADFLTSKSFLANLQSTSTELSGNFPIAEYLTATASLLKAIKKYQEQAARLTGATWEIGIPIGALTSRVIANACLANFDLTISSNEQVLAYYRYVDDFVIVASSATNAAASPEEYLEQYLPLSQLDGDSFVLDSSVLGRPTSDLRLRRSKTKIHHLTGVQGEDLIAAIRKDFVSLVSEQRTFMDASVLLEDSVTSLIRTSSSGSGTLRVLREADRAKLEHFALSNSLRTLERISDLVDRSSAQRHVRATLERLGRFLRGDDNWVQNLDLEFRLLRLASSLKDFKEVQRIFDRLDRPFRTSESGVRRTFHRGRKTDSLRVIGSIRKYLEARKLEAICSTIPPPSTATVPRNYLPWKLQHKSQTLGSLAIVRRAGLLASADLRARDREDDGYIHKTSKGRSESNPAGSFDATLKARMSLIRRFVERCQDLGDRSWDLPTWKLFLSTRPPSYFDIARRWLYRTEQDGFDAEIFRELLRIVNAVRGTAYRHPVGTVIDDGTVSLGFESGDLNESTGHTRVILGNLVVKEKYFVGGSSRRPGSSDGDPVLSLQRLQALAAVLEKSDAAARSGIGDSPQPPTILLLPELSLPRKWFRTVSRHVISNGVMGLVVGLEYLHSSNSPTVVNQAYAVLPGPFHSVASWPWTKRFPAREEAINLRKRNPPVKFRRWPKPPIKRTVVHSSHGRFSVLICSEMIECRLSAELMGRVEMVLSPSWNMDTASYDHLLRSVALQLHAVVVIANNGHYSDCRAWAPLKERWKRDLCRLIERDVNDIVMVDCPVHSLRAIHEDRPESSRETWQPLPPDWP